MKKPLLQILLVLVAASPMVYGGDAKDKTIIVPDEISQPRWSLSTGVTLSSIRTTFRGDPGFAAAALGGPLGGSADLYTGGPAAVVYADGSVGLPGTLDAPSGTTGFLGGTETPVQTGQFGFSLSQVTFHSVTGSLSPFGDDSDTGLSAGPYIKLAYLLHTWGKNSISVFAQYNFATAFDSGAPSSSSSLTTHTFAYDVFHGDFSLTVDGAAVYNAANFNANVGNGGGIAGLRLALPPRTATSTSALGIAEPMTINIYLHTFTLGIDFTRDLSERVHLVASTGPTLNLFDTHFSTPGILIVNGIPVQAATPQSESKQKFRFGWLGRVGITVDLDSQKIYFAELSGEYHWIPKFDTATSIGSARVDASSWGVSAGVGRRF